MTPATSRTELFDGARRARTLRRLLKLRTAHKLPMPKRIDFGEFSSPVDGSVLRYLTLELDDDVDVTGWAKAVDAESFDELSVTGDTHTWTLATAQTEWRYDEPRVDWHHIRVTSRHNSRPRTDRTAVTA
ncbi:hypothetical protein [Actinoplanes aureus]|uniref:Uncharacterized protein n=1 Tax=Actinoplanes aureus TaxID=2792083 RepID=A0A931CIV4_9ACTN|nr:hypothetical protein [Actinoplanes aureus]MBG0567921.1 hypothetical protein [Actinoplanes aureus]